MYIYNIIHVLYYNYVIIKCQLTLSWSVGQNQCQSLEVCVSTHQLRSLSVAMATVLSLSGTLTSTKGVFTQG